MIVLDANVLIAYFDSNNEHHDRAEALLAREIDDDFAINALTLAEVLVVPAREGRMETIQLTLTDLGVRELPFPQNSGARLAHLRSESALKMPDCCVLLAAEDAGARLASFDERLVRAARARHIVTLDR